MMKTLPNIDVLMPNLLPSTITAEVLRGIKKGAECYLESCKFDDIGGFKIESDEGRYTVVFGM